MANPFGVTSLHLVKTVCKYVVNILILLSRTEIEISVERNCRRRLDRSESWSCYYEKTFFETCPVYVTILQWAVPCMIMSWTV